MQRGWRGKGREGEREERRKRERGKEKRKKKGIHMYFEESPADSAVPGMSDLKNMATPIDASAFGLCGCVSPTPLITCESCQETNGIKFVGFKDLLDVFCRWYSRDSEHIRAVSCAQVKGGKSIIVVTILSNCPTEVEERLKAWKWIYVYRLRAS